MVLFHLEDRDCRIRTNDRIDPSIENLREILGFLCRSFLTHNQDGANEKHSERSRARPQQARNRPPTGCRSSASALPTLLATFLHDPFTELMTKEFFVLQWTRRQLALQQLTKSFCLGFFSLSASLVRQRRLEFRQFAPAELTVQP